MHCIAFSAAGLSLALKLQKKLSEAPWQKHNQVEIHAPAALLERNAAFSCANPYAHLASLLASVWHKTCGLIFIGACGIAVRAIAPFLAHKSCDPPVVVVDASCQFCISLVSGHWGGGNSLASHIARLLGCQPVITTASDKTGALALDLAIKKSGLHILDWRELARLQGKLLEGEKLVLRDPWRSLPALPQLKRAALAKDPQIIVHWRRQAVVSGCMRIALPIIHLGIGMRKGIPANVLEQCLCEILAKWDIEPKAIKALATVTEKAGENALAQISQAWNVPVAAFPASGLAIIPTPNPSPACGTRFGLPPFSVCEAAALASARLDSSRSFLLQPKLKLKGCVTIAVALAPTFNKD